MFYKNFRVLCLTGNIVIDISYNFISGRSTKTPIFSGRKYIQIDFIIVHPIYIRENYSAEQIQAAHFSYPKYAKIKFSDEHADMDKSYQFLQTV